MLQSRSLSNPLQGLILTPSFQPQVSMSLSKRKILISVLIAGAIAAVLGIFVAFGPPGLYAKSESPEFCGSCHAVQPEYEAWFHAGAHRRIKCVDCHLPNDNFVQHLTWKTLDGLKDFTGLPYGPGARQYADFRPWRQGGAGQLPALSCRDYFTD